MQLLEIFPIFWETIFSVVIWLSMLYIKMNIKLLHRLYILLTVLANFTISPILAQTPTHTNTKQHNQEIFDESLELIQQLEDPEVKTQMLFNAAQRYYETDEPETAKQLLNKALESSQNIETESSKIFLLMDMARLFADLDDLDQTAIVLDDIREKIRQLTDTSLQGILLVDLANIYAQIGNSEAANQVLAEAETIITAAKNPPPSFPFEPLPWSGTVRLGTNLFFATDNLANLNFRIEASKRWAKDEFDFYFRLFNSFDDSRPSGDENRLILDSVVEYKRYLNARKFLFFNVGYLQDDFSDIDSRLSYFGGVGFNLWRGASEKEKLDMQFGIGDLFQNSNIRNEEGGFPVFQYALIYKDLFFVDWEFEQFFIVELPVRNTPNYFIDSVTRLSIPAIYNWYVFTSLDFRYLGLASPGNTNLETRFITGLEYNF